MSNAQITAESIDLISPDIPVSRDSMGLFVDYLLSGRKSCAEWKCGLEFETFGFAAQNLERLSPVAVQQILTNMATSSDQLIYEEETLVEASVTLNDKLRGNITIEPGGQIEFSSVARRALSEIELDLDLYLKRLRTLSQQHGFIFIGGGFDPLRRPEEQRYFPKQRYQIMRPYLAGRGRRAQDMMDRTCAVQVNLDYSSEAGLGRMFSLANRIAPIVTAIFSCSPFCDGKPSGYKSTRAAAWLETDDDRAGISPLAFSETDDDFSFESYVNYLCEVPMLVARRLGRHINVAGIKFGSFLDGAYPDATPVFQDFTDHLTSIFTEARIKRYLELRSVDCCNPKFALAACALWRGLLYDDVALEDARKLMLKLVPIFEPVEYKNLQISVARHALQAKIGKTGVLDIAREIIKLAQYGLERFAPQETTYLDPLYELVIEDELTLADVLLRNWHGSWHGSITKVIDYLRI
ncbi:MAG: glutamate--cysteine ligase [Pyrinomonadaceae bacterium]